MDSISTSYVARTRSAVSFWGVARVGVFFGVLIFSGFVGVSVVWDFVGVSVVWGLVGVFAARFLSAAATFLRRKSPNQLLTLIY